MRTLPFLMILLSYGIVNTVQSQVNVRVFDDSVDRDQYAFIFSRSTSRLIDRCGDVLTTWSHSTEPGLTASITHDGQLLRSGQIDGCCFTGGLIELLDFDGTVNWSFPFANDTLQQHHDLHYMPNGNILFLGWKPLSGDELVALGKEELRSELWTEFIYEIKPIGINDFELVWEWQLSDHLIQDIDSTQSNYAQIDTSLNKVDINYSNPLQFSVRDWWHANALDYNEERDEILINSRANGELWIIDHSTTSEQAKGNSGGNRNKGGSLLFRWGNPEAYGQGTRDDLRMYGSHGHNWIKQGLPNAGKILYYNNGQERTLDQQSFRDVNSTVELLEPKIDDDSNYVIIDSKFAINSNEIVFGDPDNPVISSSFRSSAQQLPSGGFLINSADEGRLIEINADKEIIWEASTSLGFESFLYPIDFSGFDNINFEPEVNDFIAPITSNYNTLCAGIVNLTAEASSRDIQWSTGSTDSLLTVSDPGTYFYSFTNACGTRLRSDSIVITKEPLTSGSINGFTEFCGSHVELSPSDVRDNIRWSTGETTSSIQVQEEGSYYYEVLDICSGEWIRSSSHTITSFVDEKPEPRTETASVGETVFIRFSPPSPLKVYWFDTEANPGYFHQDVFFLLENVQSDTIFWVSYGISEDCLSERVPINIVVETTSTDEIADNPTIVISPNPVEETLSINSNTNLDATYLIMDREGQQIISTTDNIIDVSGIPEGLYFLHVLGQQGELIHNEKIIKI